MVGRAEPRDAGTNQCRFSRIDAQHFRSLRWVCHWILVVLELHEVQSVIDKLRQLSDVAAAVICACRHHGLGQL